jgi:hypothetical protein
MHVPLVERVYRIPMLTQKERRYVVDKNLVITVVLKSIETHGQNTPLRLGV